MRGTSGRTDTSRGSASKRLGPRRIGALALLLVASLAWPAAADPLDPTEHLLDYGLIGGAVLTLGIMRTQDPGPARIGPVYDPKDPLAILDDRYADELGGTYSPERVTLNALLVALGVGWVAAAALAATATPGSDGAVDVQRLHHGLVGYAEALLLTAAAVEVSKVVAGRLRPDFQDRVRRVHCAPGASQPLPADQCVGVAADDSSVVAEGRRSFFSGHAAAAFATATFLSLELGGRFVWGTEATTTSRWLGIAGQAALVSAATWVAWGRVADHRHHPLDVVTGAVVGVALGNLGYWRFFDTAGRPRGGPSVSLSGGPTGLAGVGLSGIF